MLATRSQSHSSLLLDPIIIISLTNSFAADVFHCLVPMLLAEEHTEKDLDPGADVRVRADNYTSNYRKKNTHLLAHGGKRGIKMATEMRGSWRDPKEQTRERISKELTTPVLPHAFPHQTSIPSCSSTARFPLLFTPRSASVVFTSFHLFHQMRKEEVSALHLFLFSFFFSNSCFILSFWSVQEEKREYC